MSFAARLAGLVVMSVFALHLFVGGGTAQTSGAVPERRLVVAPDTDFYGSDLAQLFDTTLAACQRACLTNPQCRAFTFNTRSNACFPKSEAGRIEPFAGAVSAWVRDTDAGVLARASVRESELGFLAMGDMSAARRDAEDLGTRFPAGLAAPADLLAEAAQARSQGNLARAEALQGAAVSLTDAADQWVEFSRILLANRDGSFNDRRRREYRALSAAVNGYLRGDGVAVRASAAVAIAEALQRVDRGRNSIDALRLAQSLQPRDETDAMLDAAIARWGFRMISASAETEMDSPRICAQFSETLAQAGVDYAPFVQLPVAGLAVEPAGDRLCISGVVHGERYRVTFRAGLPAASGEVLMKPVEVTQYVRDRTPMARFPGRAYVLPAAGPAAVPVESVNAPELDLALYRVSDRNLVRAMRSDLFAQPVPYWREDTLTSELAELVWSGGAAVETALNRAVTTRIPLAEMAGVTLEPGVYVLRAEVPGSDPWDSPAAHQWFVVSDLGVTTMAGVDGLHVVVRSLGSAGPVAGAEVSLVSRSNRVLGTTQTDADGYARFAPGLARGADGAAPALLTVALGDEDMAFLSLNEPEFDLSDRGVEGREPSGPVDLFVTTDRGAYRAGETVHVTALARDPAMRAIAGLPLTARLTRPDGVEYSRNLSAPAGAGGHTFALPIAGSAPRGVWRLDLLSDVTAPALTTRTFLVEDFLPERIDFDLSLPDAPLRLGDMPDLSIAARYLFGAPAGDLAIEGEVVLRARTTLPDFPGFVFGRHDARFDPEFASLPWGLRTGEDGRATLTAELPDIEDPARPLEAEFVVRLAEGSGRPVERRLARMLAPSGVVVGIGPLFDDATVPEGAEANFRLIAVDASGAPIRTRVKWTVNRVETRYQWYRSGGGDWMWEPMTTRTRIDSGEMLLGGAEMPASVGARVDWGRHELLVETIEGPYAASSFGFSAGWYAAATARETPDMLEAALDRADYLPGDTATLRIVPRAAGVALVSVLSNRLIDMRMVEVTAGENLIELPVTDDWGAGAYVTASVLRPLDGARADDRLPNRALGLAHAGVDPGARRLSAAFEGPAEVNPRGPLDVALRVKGGVPGETIHATVAAVDVGILNLTRFAAPDPAGHYFGQRKLGVGLRDIYGRLIDSTQGAMGTIRSGGDAARLGRFDAPPPTEELVAYFSGAIEVGPDGVARTRFDLPAFNGTVRLMAVVWSETSVGQAAQDVLVRDPVVVSASLPRFMAPGDESRLLLEITHAKGPGGRVGLDVAAGAGVTLGAVPSGFDLAEGGRAVFAVPVRAVAPGLAEITVSLAAPDGQTLARTLRVPVQVNDPEMSRTSRFDLAAGQSFTFDANVFAGLRAGTGTATLAVGPMARLDTAGLLRMLDRYPYGCAEQVAAAAMPLLYLGAVAEAMGLGHADDLRARVDDAVVDVLARQSAGGGFGLWFPSSGDLWLDAFITDFLSRARARGHHVPETAFRMALDNLRNNINFAPDFDSGGAPWAYALMVLAREGAAAVGDLRYYADVKPHAFDTPLAAGQLAAALALYGDQTRADAMFARAGRMMAGLGAEDRVWRADYGTNLRDAAGLLTLALESGSTAVDLAALETRIAQRRAGPLSTQEATWALLAAHALIDRPGADGFTVDGAPVTGPLVRMLDAQTAGDRAIAIRNGSNRAQTVTLTTFGVPEQPEPAGGNGYRIERSYFTLEGDAVDPARVAVGTRLVTVLDIFPFEDENARLMVADPLPAGFEIENPNLLRGGDIGALDFLGLHDWVEHAEFRQDRFLAAVNWSGTQTLRLGYMVRATTPGSYHHPAASVEDMYRPDYRAQSAAGRVSVVE